MPCPLRWLTGASLIMSISCAVLPALASPLTDGLPVAATVKQAAAVRAPWREQDPRVRVLGSQVYSNTPASGPQTLDLYLPRHPAGRRPLLVYVHGGGWSQGDARTAGAFVDFPELLRRLAQQGYAVASVNYRLSPAATFPAPLDDIKDAMAWLHDHARRYGIDPARTALWGSSAGGHLAALAALSPDRRYPAVKAWVSWFGVFDLAGLLDDPPCGPSPRRPRPCWAAPRLPVPPSSWPWPARRHCWAPRRRRCC
ncbi:alpha/beta hydrolase [Pseudomonas sp. HR96]|uniref:alpha/beta hydrolase n=1 Tax=Pseudomonas sp. HR96 TaxID=1027966 RepID=UPI002A76016C|nr:alpha/beta hydrolase [Pseudomonas sp. HR96]WPO97564.1 alpha/beta hydrolase [Pseudomonas sp. HR96]